MKKEKNYFFLPRLDFFWTLEERRFSCSFLREADAFTRERLLFRFRDTVFFLADWRALRERRPERVFLLG